MDDKVVIQVVKYSELCLADFYIAYCRTLLLYCDLIGILRGIYG